jgi:hypothetical protein
MGKQKRHTAAQIIAKLRDADVELGSGVPVGLICRKLEISEHTYSGAAAQLFGLPPTRTRGGTWAADLSRILTLDVVLKPGAGHG